MAKNQSTYTLKIDAELGNLQKTLNEAKNSLSSFMASGNAPKGLEKAFEKISDLLGQITNKAGKPLDLKGLNAAGRDLDSVQENFRAIIRLLGEFGDLSDDVKLSFLSPDEQKKIQDATKALQTYGKAMEEVAKKQKSLEAMQKTEQKNQVALDKAKKKVSGLSDERTLTQAKMTGAKGKLDAAKGLENANPKDVAKYEAEVAKLKAELEILDKNLSEANKELNTAQTAYNGSADAVKKMEAEIKRASGASLKQLKEEATALGISLEGLNGHNAAKQVEILTNRLEEFKKETMEGAQPAFEAIKKGCEGAEKAADGLQDELKEAVEATKAMDEAAAQRDAFENKIKSFLGLSGAAQVMRAALRDAISTITELDAVMGQMAVVTDLTVGDYWDQLPEYSERASKLGVSITSAYEAATLYYQQGLKANEVTALSEQTLKMAAIAGLDAADATDRMTAALRGFNMELNEANAQKIADVYSELAAITAADVDEISTAMTKTASIASSAGMEFETTAAFLSQIIETTRESAETAGTAMKTVIARFQELKKSPSEIGEIDGEIVDANAIETALRSVGVSLRDSSGQFRELDDVFLELSSKWDGLDKNTQRYIATIAAGSRQQSRFIAMMSDYERTVELVDAANTSVSASNKQFEKTTETLGFKINQLKNAWHEFTMGIMNSDLVKTGVDILTKFLNIVNKATSALDGIGGSLMKIATVLGVFKLGSKIFDKFRQPVIDLFADIVKRAGIAGTDSAKAYTESVEREKNRTSSTREKQQDNTQPRSFWQKAGDFAFGLDKWQAGSQHGKKRKEARDVLKNYDRKALEQKIKTGTTTEIEIAKKDLEAYDAIQREVVEEGKAQWEDYGDAIGQIGSNVTGLGVGISMIGGILTSLGLEEQGETLTEIGTVITFIGTALMAIPPILTIISTHPIVAIVVLALGLILAGVMAIVKAWNKNSPAEKLKEAQKAAEAAGNAAKQAADNYKYLNDSLEDLSDKYKTLEELTRGTKQWKEAIQGINGIVLELIEKYPELEQFLDGSDGVLRLNLDDEGLQEIIINAQMAQVITSNAAKRAEQKVTMTKYSANLAGTSGTNALANKNTGKIIAENTSGWAANLAITGAAAGAIIGGPVGALVGALGGLVIGAVGGGIKGALEADAVANAIKNDEDIQKRIGNVAQQASKEEKTDYDFLYEQFRGQEFTEEEAKILAKAYSKNSEELLTIGEQLNETESQLNTLSEAMTAQTKVLIDQPKNLTREQEALFWAMTDSVLTAEDYSRMYTEEFEKLENGETVFSDKQKKEIIESLGGAGAKLEDGKIVNKGETILEDVTDEYLFSVYAEQLAAERFEKAGESTWGMLQNIQTVTNTDMDKTLARLFSSAEGYQLTQADIDALTNKEGKVDVNTSFYWKILTKEQKDLFGSEDAFANYFQNAVDEARKQFRSADDILVDGLSFTGVNSQQAHNLAKITKGMTKEEQENFVTDLNKIVSDIPEAQKDLFVSSIAGLSSESSREEWQKVIEALRGLGVPITEQMQNFIDTNTDVLGTTYTDTWLKQIGVSEELISQYEATTDSAELDKFHATFKKWKQDYDSVNSGAAKAEHELMTQTIDAIIDSREKQIDAYKEAVNAEAEANSNLISKISNNVARLRELREKEETEKAISKNLSKQAYLGMDTSGGNALELLRLQEENKQMTQDYEDQLVDQAIARLEEDNDKALEQREKQIELMREQLEIYKNSGQILADAKTLIEEAKNALTNGADVENTTLGQLLKPEKFTSTFEQSTFWNGIREGLAKLVPENNDTGNDNNKSNDDNNESNDGSSPSYDGKPKAVVTIDGGAYNSTLNNEPARRRQFTEISIYKTGGLANFTGPAWLDGTPSKPEYVLNAEQTERFFSLIDVLEGIDADKASAKSSGDNYFDINIQVDKLDDDYDVERMADKIRRMIYEDATYRNVNAINHIR